MYYIQDDDFRIQSLKLIILFVYIKDLLFNTVTQIAPALPLFSGCAHNPYRKNGGS